MEETRALISTCGQCPWPENCYVYIASYWYIYIATGVYIYILQANGEYILASGECIYS